MCTNNEHEYYKMTTQDRDLWQPFWIFSGHFGIVVVAVVVSACFSICDTFIHLVEKQHLQTQGILEIYSLSFRFYGARW